MFLFALKNVVRRKNKVIISITITALTIFIFSIIWNVYSVIQSGMELSEKRMGADILIYPENANGTAEELLFTGAAEMVYMEEDPLMNEIPMKYVDKVTNEFYLQTIPGGGCCATNDIVRIIGIDRDNDFLLEPWFKETNNVDFGESDIILGSDIDIEAGDITTILGNVFQVKGTLYKTGTGLDQSLFIDINTARRLGKLNFSSNYFDNMDTEDIITSCFIKLKPGVAVEKFIDHFPADDLGVKVASVSDSRRQLQEQNTALLNVLGLFCGAIFLIALIALFSRYNAIILERKQETGYLRAIGMQKWKIIMLYLTEVGLQAAIGGIIGGVLGSIAFHSLLGKIAEIVVLPTGEWNTQILLLHLLGDIGVAIIISVLAVMIPALKNVSMDPQQTLTEGAVR